MLKLLSIGHNTEINLTQLDCLPPFAGEAITHSEADTGEFLRSPRDDFR